MKTRLFAALLLFAGLHASAEWTAHNVQFVSGNEPPLQLSAKLNKVTESWNRVVAVPYIVYMPEEDRVLMLVSCDYPHQAMVLESNDRGKTWSDPRFVHLGADGKPDTGMGIGLTYLGGGRLLLTAAHRWFSDNYGETWQDYGVTPTFADGANWNGWDPLFVDREPDTGKIRRLIETGYTMDGKLWESGGTGYSKGHFRISTDEGKTWGAETKAPEWDGGSEVTIIRAKNGDLVAASRTDKPARLTEVLDHHEGLAVSISKDDGKTWSPYNRLYEWGRHHPSLVMMPDGMLVMTYVARKGYKDSADGFPQFGIEAIVSRDNGQTWDLDHRYVLHWWKGNRTGPNGWWASCQATSTVLLPDGALLTAFGTGYRSEPNAQNLPAPRDAMVVEWRLAESLPAFGGPVTSAPIESDARNVFDPAMLK